MVWYRYLIERNVGLDFHCECNITLHELQTMATWLFRHNGTLRSDYWPMLKRKEMNTGSGGGFLTVYMLKIDKEHRGNDLGYLRLRFLFESLKDRWMISVCELCKRG